MFRPHPIVTNGPKRLEEKNIRKTVAQNLQARKGHCWFTTFGRSRGGQINHVGRPAALRGFAPAFLRPKQWKKRRYSL